jgi:hypothetical protein
LEHALIEAHADHLRRARAVQLRVDLSKAIAQPLRLAVHRDRVRQRGRGAPGGERRHPDQQRPRAVHQTFLPDAQTAAPEPDDAPVRRAGQGIKVRNDFRVWRRDIRVVDRTGSLVLSPMRIRSRRVLLSA